MANAEKVFLAGVVRETGWLYYLDKECNIGRSKMVRGGQRQSASDKPEVVMKTDIERSEGYLYFIDKQGDISRIKMSRGGSVHRRKKAKRKSVKKAAVFKFRVEPKAPERKTLSEFIPFADRKLIKTLEDLILFASDRNLSAADFKLTNTWGDFCTPSFKRPESDESFNERTESYLKRKASWDRWYEANKEKADAELKRRAVIVEKELHKKLAKLKKDKDKLDKKMADLKSSGK
jgi:hypothetical protein